MNRFHTFTDSNSQVQREWEQHLGMNSNRSNNQYSKLISIEHSRMDDTNEEGIRHVENLEYLNIINIQLIHLLSNVTERG